MVRLILETAAADGGKVGFDPLPALAPALLGQIEVFTWPRDRRPADDLGRRGSLHMKCAVADSELVLVSSANLTELAFDLNMELGVLIRSESVGRQLTRHLESLIHQLTLRRYDPARTS
jgi:phosphatidylserine/phosphatidylglycerophosphate/cardiolipin synthase-like enzyme